MRRATAVVAVVVVVQVVVTRVPIKVVVTLKLGVIMTHRRTSASKPVHNKAKAALEDACTGNDGCESGYCADYKCKVKMFYDLCEL